MDEGEEDGADAFDADYDVKVLFYALYVAFISFIQATDDTYSVVFFEIRFVKNLAARCVVG